MLAPWLCHFGPRGELSVVSLFLIFWVVFLNFWLLDAGIPCFGPQTRILREISSPEPAGKVQNPESRSKIANLFFDMFFMNTMSG